MSTQFWTFCSFFSQYVKNYFKQKVFAKGSKFSEICLHEQMHKGTVVVSSAEFYFFVFARKFPCLRNFFTINIYKTIHVVPTTFLQFDFSTNKTKNEKKFLNICLNCYKAHFLWRHRKFYSVWTKLLRILRKIATCAQNLSQIL